MVDTSLVLAANLEQPVAALEAKIDRLASEDGTTVTDDGEDLEPAADHEAVRGSDAEPDYDGVYTGPYAESLDPDAMDEEEFTDAWDRMNSEERGRFVSQQFGSHETGNEYLEAISNDAVKGAISGGISGYKEAGKHPVGKTGTMAMVTAGAVIGAGKGGFQGLAGKGAEDTTSRMSRAKSLPRSVAGSIKNLGSEVRDGWTDFEMSEGLTGKVGDYVGMGNTTDSHDKYD
ncbi:hypothetical protein HARCEL1_02820 [Halococcoides cellulosivorans]|uniref:Uncharacterized protein n=1 Tax=Halococcoides cellulosivorans TaxID=1679096 RepID=A0A2R4WYW6_9EURY|nr:hypothetical protein HARCEL1_02820 [Halococcoides cellulosivorans]